MSDPELRALISACSAPHVRLAVILLVATGARVGAVLDLTWDRVSFETGLTSDEILDLITALSKEHGKTILMVTHDPKAAERASALLHLDKGVLVEAQKAAEEVPA